MMTAEEHERVLKEATYFRSYIRGLSTILPEPWVSRILLIGTVEFLKRSVGKAQTEQLLLDEAARIHTGAQPE